MLRHTEIINGSHFEEQYRFLPAHEAIAGQVAFYWQLDLRNHSVNQEFSDQILANLNTSVVFNLGSGYALVDSSTNQETLLRQSIIIGHHTHLMQYRHYEGNFLFGVKFRPAGFNRIFGVSSAALTNGFAGAEDFFRNLYLEERLAESGTMEQRKDLLDATLIALFSAARPDHRIQAVHTALTEVVVKNGIYQVGELASCLHITQRSLERYFKEAIGVSPKTALAIIRFRLALKKFSNGTDPFFADEAGYYDLSHFMKDYRKYMNNL